MPALEVRERPATKTPGRLGQALIRLLMRRATVTTVDQPADRFRLITLEGPALQDVAWSPGQKIQIAMGSAFVARTYTPIEWDAVAGRTRILGYAHGVGPGSRWLLDLRPGAECDLFGPRAGLGARPPAGSFSVFGPVGSQSVFGDETSIGLAHALARQDPGRPFTAHLEVEDMEGARRVVTQLGIGNVALFPKEAGDAHLEGMEAAISDLAAAGASFVLTGRASTIQRLRQFLKQRAVPGAHIVTKAHWAPGKTGLD